MSTFIRHQKYKLRRAAVSLLAIFAFLGTSLTPNVIAQSIMLSIQPSKTIIQPTAAFEPVQLSGINIHPDNPLKFDFIIAEGSEPTSESIFKAESDQIIKYFLTALTTPHKDMWVNLSPHEKNRIIADNLRHTAMGQEMLLQDYILKQLTASLMFPKEELGQDFWKRVYEKSQKQFGTTDFNFDTFNKVWIVPEHATIFEHTKGAYILNSNLKVLLEEDYKALEHSSLKNEDNPLDPEISNLTKEIIREIIIPEIELEVNRGRHFAKLRQIYHAMILSAWYKERLKNSLLAQSYADQSKLAGITTNHPEIIEEIYEQYVETFKSGVYDFIKEDFDPVTQEMIPRKYFSGGIAQMKPSSIEVVDKASISEIDLLKNILLSSKKHVVTTALNEKFTPFKSKIFSSIVGFLMAASVSQNTLADHNLNDFEQPHNDLEYSFKYSNRKDSILPGKLDLSKAPDSLLDPLIDDFLDDFFDDSLDSSLDNDLNEDYQSLINSITNNSYLHQLVEEQLRKKIIEFNIEKSESIEFKIKGATPFTTIKEDGVNFGMNYWLSLTAQDMLVSASAAATTHTLITRQQILDILSEFVADISLDGLAEFLEEYPEIEDAIFESLDPDEQIVFQEIISGVTQLTQQEIFEYYNENVLPSLEADLPSSIAYEDEFRSTSKRLQSLWANFHLGTYVAFPLFDTGRHGLSLKGDAFTNLSVPLSEDEEELGALLRGNDLPNYGGRYSLKYTFYQNYDRFYSDIFFLEVGEKLEYSIFNLQDDLIEEERETRTTFIKAGYSWAKIQGFFNTRVELVGEVFEKAHRFKGFIVNEDPDPVFMLTLRFSRQQTPQTPKYTTSLSGDKDGGSVLISVARPSKDVIVISEEFSSQEKERQALENEIGHVHATEHAHEEDLADENEQPTSIFDEDVNNDKAMFSEDETVGGIDLNPDILKLNVTNGGLNMPDFPTAPHSNQAIIEGFIPQILNIQPVLNLPQLIGINQPEDASDAPFQLSSSRNTYYVDPQSDKE